MTTCIVVKALHGWPVKVTRLMGLAETDIIVAAGTEREFHIWDDCDLRLHEIQPNEPDAEQRMFSFGEAIRLLKLGNRVARRGWNGANMFIVLMPELHLPPFNTQGTDRKVNDRTAKWIGEDTPLNCRPYLAIYNARGEWQPGWTASQADILADDWTLAWQFDKRGRPHASNDE